MPWDFHYSRNPHYFMEIATVHGDVDIYENLKISRQFPDFMKMICIHTWNPNMSWGSQGFTRIPIFHGLSTISREFHHFIEHPWQSQGFEIDTPPLAILGAGSLKISFTEGGSYYEEGFIPKFGDTCARTCLAISWPGTSTPNGRKTDTRKTNGNIRFTMFSRWQENTAWNLTVYGKPLKTIGKTRFWART